MRIRQIKPAFWSDSKLAELPEGTRLFYVGLWMLADDAGWLAWDPAEAAHELYGYETRAKRERRVVEMFATLAARGRVVLHPCGHAFLPNLVEHQRLAGMTKRVESTWKDHQRCTPAKAKDEPPADPPHIPAGPRDSPRIPGTEKEREREKELVRNGNWNGQERSGKGASATDDGSLSEFRAKVPLASILGGKTA